MTINSVAPMRVDFAGGTLDLPPIFLFHHPAPTVNASINVKASVKITPSDKMTIVSKDQNVSASWNSWEEVEWENQPMLELAGRLIKVFQPDPITIEITSEAPAGSGLGGSSVIGIAITAALAKYVGKELNQRELVEITKSIETQTIKVPTGYQDYWGAVYGGVNAYQIELDGNLTINKLGSAEFRKQLDDHMMLVYVGKPHFSGVNNWQLFKNHIDNEGGTVEFFEDLKQNAVAMQQAFEAEDMNAIAENMNKDWQVRKAMLPTMTTPEIETLTEKAMANGAMALRVCGAGAGGCALLLVDPAKREAVTNVVNELGMQILDGSISAEGVTVTAS